MSGLDADQMHVILDALGCLHNAIEHGDAQPWAGYTGDPDDPKTSKQTYLPIIDAAEATVEQQLAAEP